MRAMSGRTAFCVLVGEIAEPERRSKSCAGPTKLSAPSLNNH